MEQAPRRTGTTAVCFALGAFAGAGCGNAQNHVPPECQGPEVKFEGNVGGPVSSAEFAARFAATTEPLHYVVFDSDGLLALLGSGMLETGVARPVQALVHLPQGNYGGDAWFCAIDGSMTAMPVDAWLATQEFGRTFALEQVRRLGTCPATPVDGTVTFCTGSPSNFCPQSSSLEGTVDGAPVAVDAIGLFQEDGAIPLTGGALVWLVRSESVVTGGILRLQRGGGDEGFDVFCIDDGTFEREPETFRSRYTVTGLSRLAGCIDAPMAGSLAGCSGF